MVDVSQPTLAPDLGLNIGPDPRVEAPTLARLFNTVEGEVIPRLLLASREPRPVLPVPPRTRAAENREHVRELAGRVLAQDLEGAHAYALELHAGGLDLASFHLDVLAPVARYLGELWGEDRCDFTQVTLGVGTLQELLRALSPLFHHEPECDGQCRRILLVPGPKEQHVFGLLMVAEFFRRAGWDVWGGPSFCAEEVLTLVRSEHFDAVGLSTSCTRHVDALTRHIRDVRRASRNRRLGVMVGGPTFLHDARLANHVGADIMAGDARGAPDQAREMVALLQGRARRRVNGHSS